MKALIAMSGGVDSSVAALLMKEKGYECIGCTMRLYSNEDIGAQESTCCSLDDVEDAKSVCRNLGIPHYTFNFSELFREKVIDPFISCYERGITPNPCIECNRHLKFDKLHERAEILGCEKVVTGHYAQIREKDGIYYLCKAKDPNKDQTYVLYSMTQEQLAHTEFPLGGMEKSEARNEAETHEFINAHKGDSQDICFVPDGDYVAAIRRFSGKTFAEGDFVDGNGKILGKHKGIVHYTIGQRKGLGIAFGEPRYVCRIDAKNNQVVLGRNEELFSCLVNVEDVNWILPAEVGTKIRCCAKIRYRQVEQPAEVEVLEGNRARVIFDKPQRAITPGQAAVFYDGDLVLGGGTIIL